MKILHISKFEPGYKGGVEKEAQRVLNQLRHSFLVYSIYFGTKVSSKGKNFSVHKSFRFMNKVDLSFSYIYVFLKQYRRSEIVWLHYPNILPALLIACLSKGSRKIIIHWHNDIMVLPKLYFIFKFFENRILEKCDTVVDTSSSYAEGSKALSIHSKKLRVCNICINVRDGFYRKAYKPQDEMKLITVGRYTSYKGFESLPAIFSKNKNLKLTLVTDQSIPNVLLKELDSLENIHLYFNVSDEQLRDLYFNNDMYLFTSTERNEGFGIVLLEALKYGLPLLVNRIRFSGSEYLMLQEDFGRFYEITRPQSLTNAIDSITKDERTYVRLSRKGHDYLMANHDLTKDESFLGVLDELLR